MEMDVTDENFQEEVLERSNEVPVLVDFWASWCGPCMMLGPVLERVAEDYKGKLILAKAKTDDNQNSAMAYGVMSIPAVKLIKNKEVVAEFIGAKSEDSIRQWLDENL